MLDRRRPGCSFLRFILIRSICCMPATTTKVSARFSDWGPSASLSFLSSLLSPFLPFPFLSQILPFSLPFPVYSLPQGPCPWTSYKAVWGALQASREGGQSASWQTIWYRAYFSQKEQLWFPLQEEWSLRTAFSQQKKNENSFPTVLTEINPCLWNLRHILCVFRFTEW